ncbi:MAG TPA: NAD(P)-dependent oxidoreductase [Amycolatopsis sp.]|uniref:NAD-dependent epimerase/dehydratase family protein n=1 Tax=Amycolatopsis sp. TaxID=37632 RepID=UPI002B4A2AF4|nr:NAD(P)-dependent oxidoreductase [Amycolatopsis sp.]HKS48441.1 NAD(P)-dependent oxidoreductase [Amycolatopsis sp.]
MSKRVLLAGATGVIGRELVPMLRGRGHRVTALVRDPSRAAGLAVDDIVVADALDAPAVRSAVLSARPQVVVHQLTALRVSTGEGMETTARLRIEGTTNLVRAAVRAGARRIVAQSIAFATAPRGGGVLTEDAPLFFDAPDPGWSRTVRAVAELEHTVLGTHDITGLVLRYGSLYGPGTLYHPDGAIGAAVGRGRFPLPESAAGVTSFLHVADAASAAVAAVESEIGGVFNVSDDEPAEAATWVPAYARMLGAPPPRTVPVMLIERMSGWLTGYQLTAMRGAANGYAKRVLGWRPRTPSWRTGLEVASLGP